MVDTRIIVPRARRERRLGIIVPSPSLALSGGGLSAYTDVTIATIPDITIPEGGIFLLASYIDDPGGNIISGSILNLNTAVATYNNSTQRITGVSEGLTTGLQLQLVTAQTTVTSNTFFVQVEAALELGLSVIPDISLQTGQTHDMSQYIINPGGLTLTTSMAGLNSSVATYDDSTRLLTGVAAGFISGASFVVEEAAQEQSSTPDYSDPVAGVSLLSGRTIVNVANDSQLAAALNNATAGTTIRLADGVTYGGNYALSQVFPANNPLIVVGTYGHTSTLTGTWTFTGNNTILMGCRITGNILLRGFNNKVLANKMTQWVNNCIVPGNNASPGSHCEVAYNEAWAPAAWGPDTGSNTQFRMWLRATTGGDDQYNTVHTHAWVHHNFIHDMPEKPDPSRFSSGQSDSIEPGESSYNWSQYPYSPRFFSRWYIEDNLEKDHLQSGGGAVYDCKLPGTIFRRITIINAASPKISLRLGHSSIIESCWWGLNEGRIEVHGRRHKIIANNMNGGFGILLISGAQSADSDENGQGSAAETHVASNIGRVVVGYDRGSVFPAEDTLIEDHTGDVTLVSGNHTGTINTPSASPTYTAPSAVQLTESDVGPDAILSASSNYRAARGTSLLLPQSQTATPDYDDPVAGITLLGGRRTVNVANNSQLSSALSNALPGDTIQLASGSFSSNYTINKSPAANNPIIIKGAPNFASSMSGLLVMLGQNIILTGVLFNGAVATQVRLRGFNNKVIGNKFTNVHGVSVNVGNKPGDPGSHGEIAYNEFWSPDDWEFVYPEATEIRMAIRSQAGSAFNTVHTDCWIHHNYVHDWPGKPNPSIYASGQSDSFETPSSPLYSWMLTPIGWYVEDNVIQRHGQSGAPSIVDFKAAGCVGRRNTALESSGIGIDARHGGTAIIEANWMGGTHCHSIGNIIAGNVLTDSKGIGLMAGDRPYTQNFTPDKGYAQNVDNHVCGNQGLLTVGKFYAGQADRILPVLNALIEDHTGNVNYDPNQGTHSTVVDNRNGLSTRLHEFAVQGSPNDVGPDALSAATAAYRSARGL